MIGGTVNDYANAKGDNVEDSESVHQPARRQGGKDFVDFVDYSLKRVPVHPWSLEAAELGSVDLLVSSCSQPPPHWRSKAPVLNTDTPPS